MPFAGHVGPMSAIAAELVRRGHEVVAYTGAKYRGRFTSLGTGWLPWIKATDFDDADLAATFPKVGNGKGLRSGKANVEHVLFGTAAGQLADIMTGAPYDLLVTDQLAFGTAVAGPALGVPWATVTVTPLTLTSRDLAPTGMPWNPATGPAGRARDAVARGLVAVASRRMTDPKLNVLRASAGLAPVRPGRLFDGTYSTDLVIAQGVPGLEYPRPDLPEYVHYVGRLAPAAPPTTEADLPSWWPDIAAASKIVHVTQGTLDTDPQDLLRPAMAGLADRDVLVVCSTGGADPETLGRLPTNARAAAFLPHDLLLPLVDVMVTNGGWGGVLGGIQAGTPLVVAGASLDKPEVARRVAWSGAGLDLRTGRPKPDRVARAVDRVLADDSFRTRAGELSTALTAAGGATRAGELIEDLLPG
jgi:MGT family glycosyltransferase